MRKFLIAALVLAAGCGSTRRDFKFCDDKYPECGKGFTCNHTTEMCEPDAVDAPIDRPVGVETSVGPDNPAAEVASPDAGDAPIADVSAEAQPPIDQAPTDTPITLDVPADTRVPDAGGSCSVDSDCTGSGLPVCVNNRCMACRTNAQCSGATPFCSAAHTCVSCASAVGDAGVCSGAAPVCDPRSGGCVECVRNTDCPNAARAFCVANQCQGCNAPGATATTSAVDGGVADGGAAADGGVGSACTGAKPACASSGPLVGQCVQCVTNAHCSGTKPICDTNNTCIACTSDSQCTGLGGPGVCMFHQDGRCASEAETIYVKNSSSCTGGSGTAPTPYCDTQAAVNAVTASKRVIVVKGPATDVITPISSTPSGAQVTIVGQNNATTSAGASIGIHVTAGDVYIRGLTVANGSSRVGIQVDSGATLRLDRCIVKNNAGGGLLVQSGASFEVANCVFDGNGPGSVGPVAFGGVYLAGSAPAGKPHTFWFSTIVNNEDRGIVCADSTQASSGMLLYGNVNGGYLNCAMDSTNSKWDSPGAGSDVSDPALSSANPYHLTTSSHCRDFVAATVAHPTYDLDGDVRPYPAGGKLDCGADEYHP